LVSIAIKPPFGIDTTTAYASFMMESMEGTSNGNAAAVATMLLLLSFEPLLLLLPSLLPQPK
jgi:hypothetical protein